MIGLDKLCEFLQKYQGPVTPELAVQDTIDDILIDIGSIGRYCREYDLGAGYGRIDFFVHGIGIEVKVGGTPNQLSAQLWSYCKSAEIKSIIVVTTRAKLAPSYTELLTKPIRTVALWRGML